MGIRVLSLFDGMSCGQLALQKLGIEVDTYYASEIDKYAIQVAKENFPKTIHVGDVCQLKSEDYKDIDLILAGSPCQGFSFAGKQLAFDDPRSALFFEFIRLLKEIKPKYFLLENVRMKQQFQDVITDQVSACYPDYQGDDLFGSKIKPILINSALLSAQNRLRLYWTNIPNIEQPKDKGIVLKDILIAEEEWQEEVPQYLKNHFHGEPRANQVRHIDVGKSKTLTATMYKGQIQSWIKKDFISPDRVKKYVEDETSEVNDTYNKRTIKGDKSTTIRPNNNTGNIWVNDQAIKETKPIQVGIASEINGHDILKRVYSPEGKSPTLNTMQGGNREPKVAVEYKAMTEVRTPEANAIRREHKKKTGKDWSPREMRKLVERDDDKMNTLTSALTKQHIIQAKEETTLSWRKLLPIECERLQTVPDNYTSCVSKTQRFKMLGNGWTIDVIAHILKNMDL